MKKILILSTLLIPIISLAQNNAQSTDTFLTKNMLMFTNYLMCQYDTII